jgi:hypothetical protein
MPVCQSYQRQHSMSYPQIVVFSPGGVWKYRLAVDNSVESRGQSRYFHWVETPNPAAMKPKPTTMFQLSSESIGSVPSVT